MRAVDGSSASRGRCAVEHLDASTASVVEATRLADGAGRRPGPPVGRALRARRRRRGSPLRGLRAAAGASSTDRWSSVASWARVPGVGADGAARRRPRAPAAGSSGSSPPRRRDGRPLDLRRESQLARSVLLHRLRAARRRLGHARSTPGGTTGTFKEAWELEWHPELAVAVIEAGLFGTTVARRRGGQGRRARAGRSEDLATLGRLVSPVPARRPARGAALGRRRARGAHGQAARRPGAAR